MYIWTSVWTLSVYCTLHSLIYEAPEWQISRLRIDLTNMFGLVFGTESHLFPWIVTSGTSLLIMDLRGPASFQHPHKLTDFSICCVYTYNHDNIRTFWSGRNWNQICSNVIKSSPKLRNFYLPLTSSQIFSIFDVVETIRYLALSSFKSRYNG